MPAPSDPSVIAEIPPTEPAAIDASRAGDRAPTPAAGAVMIRGERLGKKFKIYPRPWARLSEWLTAGRAVRHEAFWALRDVSFEVRRGECLGVIGVNGSGKSTLLKVLSGAMYPTEGTFTTAGRVLSLLELGTGLNPDLTGRQNVQQSARLLALGPDYAATKMGAVEAFAELGDFFDRPIRVYSSGMLVRLVFSMFANFEPDVFIVDEALSVGDLHFQQKCTARIREMLARGVTMLFVSHDLAAVEMLCNRVMVLHGGRQQFLGDRATGLSVYYSLVGTGLAPAAATTTPAPAAPEPSDGIAGDADAAPLNFDPTSIGWHAPDASDAGGDGRVRIAGVAYRRDDGIATQVLERDKFIDVFVRYEAAADVGPVNGGLGLYDRFGQLLFAVNWLTADLDPLWLKAGQSAVARFRLAAKLEPGEYALSLAASEALRDPASHTGWNQHLGGADHATLPRGGKLAVIPRSDNRRRSYGPANLDYELERSVV